MPTVNFSVPKEVKEAFNDAFAGENKSAVIARLMLEAVEDRRRKERRIAAIDELLALRRRQEPVTEEQTQRAREASRP